MEDSITFPLLSSRFKGGPHFPHRPNGHLGPTQVLYYLVDITALGQNAKRAWIAKKHRPRKRLGWKARADILANRTAIAPMN